MDEIDIPTYETISTWQAAEKIALSSKTEEELYDNLQNRGYLVENDAEETTRKEEILTALRKHHAFDREKCRYMTFIMTYDCNFRCAYCFEGEAAVKKEVMTPQLIDAASW